MNLFYLQLVESIIEKVEVMKISVDNSEKSEVSILS